VQATVEKGIDCCGKDRLGSQLISVYAHDQQAELGDGGPLLAFLARRVSVEERQDQRVLL